VQSSDVARTANRNRPTIAALIVAFGTELIRWGFTFIPPDVPPGVTGTGYALAIALFGVAVGKAAQGELGRRWLEARAPWADDTHRLATAYALLHDPDSHPEEVQALLDRLGLDSPDEVYQQVGALPGPDDPDA
jgi:hypothetical protein